MFVDLILPEDGRKREQTLLAVRLYHHYAFIFPVSILRRSFGGL